MTCAEYREWVVASDEAPSGGHAADCTACRAFAEDAARDAHLLRNLPSLPVPADLWTRLERRLPPVRRPALRPRHIAAACVAAALLVVALWGVRPPAAPDGPRREVVIVDAPERDLRAERGYLREFASQGGAGALAIMADEGEGD